MGKKFSGNAVKVTLQNSITAASTTIEGDVSTGWPAGGGSDTFVGVIGRGTASEEKVLFSSRTGTTWAVSQRGYDGTTAASHSAGEFLEHVIDSVAMQSYEDHLADATDAHDASAISYAGSTNLVATDVEAALDELDVEKLALAGGTMSGELILADNLLTRPVLKDYAEQVNAYGPVSGTVALNLDTANVWTFTLAGATTFSDITGEVAGKSHSLTLVLTQDATGGRTVTWPASVKWAGGTAPTLSTAANAIDIITLLTVDGGTTWYGFVGGKAFA